MLLNNATMFAIEKLALPVNDVLKDFKTPSRREAAAEAKPVEFACPGSVLRMQFDVKHPVGYGMPEEGPAMFIQSPAFRSTRRLEARPGLRRRLRTTQAATC